MSKMNWKKSNQFLVLLGSLLLLLLIVRIGAIDSQSNILASGCTGQTVKLTCQPYQKIAIKRVFYGVKRNWDCAPKNTYKEGNSLGNRMSHANTSASCCRASHVDCHNDGDSMYSTLNIKCSGYKSCELEVQKIPTREPCRFKSYTDYMNIVYDCISAGDIATFCSNDVKTGKSLYLANKEYPGSIRAKQEGDECQCLIRTSYQFGITIHTIDVLLAGADSDPAGCKRSLKIKDPLSYHRDIQCAHRGYYGFKSIYSRPVNNVSVTLSSQPGDGMAFVWLQVKPNDADGVVEILCGQPLQELLIRLRHLSEARQRESTATDETIKVTDDDDEEGDKKSNATITMKSGSHTMNSDLAAIVCGIVVAGFILIAMVIVAMALHCRRMQKEKRVTKPLELYPAVDSEPLDLSSYCRYDYDDDHLCTINRSPIKMATLADEGSVSNSFKPNGFVTTAHTEECQLPRDTPSPPLPPGISTPPPSLQNQPLLGGRQYREVHYPGDMSLRFVKPLINNSNMTATTIDVTPYQHLPGHTTLPSNRKAVLISCGPKSPLGKRSKSVTFSQPVAMVTPLNSESEESVEKPEVNEDMDDPSYDNLNKLDIPDYPILPGKSELIKIPRWDIEYTDDSQIRPLSTFQNSPSSSPTSETKSFISKTFVLPLSNEMGDNDSTSHVTNSPAFWSPTRQTGKPLVMPKPQKAELYETGV